MHMLFVLYKILQAMLVFILNSWVKLLPGSWDALWSLPEPDDDLGVADDDGGEGEDKLCDISEGAIH